MNFKCLKPEELIKLSTSITLLLTEKFNCDDLNTIKNILCSVTNNLSSFLSQKVFNDKDKKK